MPHKCTICEHPRRRDIESAIVSGESYRKAAIRFTPPGSQASIQRHIANCLSRAVEKAKAAQEVVREARDAETVQVIRESASEEARLTVQSLRSIEQIINLVIDRAFKLYDACDRYLEHPDFPGEYVLDARASEIQIVWEEVQGWQDGHAKPCQDPGWVKRSGR